MTSLPSLIAFDVEGMEPVGQGSMYVHHDPHTGVAGLRHDRGDLLIWRKAVAFTARRVVKARPHFGAHQPLVLGVVFRLLPPEYGRPGSRMAQDFPVCKQDFDKLLRAVCDALTGTLYADDGQVIGNAIEGPGGKLVGLPSFKRYTRPGELPGCFIRCAPARDLLAWQGAALIDDQRVTNPANAATEAFVPDCGQSVDKRLANSESQTSTTGTTNTTAGAGRPGLGAGSPGVGEGAEPLTRQALEALIVGTIQRPDIEPGSIALRCKFMRQRCGELLTEYGKTWLLTPWAVAAIEQLVAPGNAWLTLGPQHLETLDNLKHALIRSVRVNGQQDALSAVERAISRLTRPARLAAELGEPHAAQAI